MSLLCSQAAFSSVPFQLTEGTGGILVSPQLQPRLRNPFTRRNKAVRSTLFWGKESVTGAVVSVTTGVIAASFAQQIKQRVTHRSAANLKVPVIITS